MSTHAYGRWAAGFVVVVLAGTIAPLLPVTGDFLRGFSSLWGPLLWCGLAAAALWLPRPHLPGRMGLRGQFTGLALFCAVFFLALRFCVGLLIQEIASSPYDLSPLGILLNFWSIFPFLIVCETLRAYVIGAAYRGSRHHKIWIAAITLVLGAVQINFSKIATLNTGEEWFIYGAKDILPLLTQSYLLTVLVYCGGAAAGVIYSGVISGFLHIFPFLPSLPWIGESAVGIIFPVVAGVFVWEQYRVLSHMQTPAKKEPAALFGIALALSVAFAWFVVGVFPVYPSVVLTGSMEPGILPGDVVLIKKFQEEKEFYNLAEEDIINFQREDIIITHRIVGVIYDEDGNIGFETKGDNNREADQQIVTPNDLNGIVQKIVPKVGLPVLWLRGQGPLPEGVVDNEEA